MKNLNVTVECLCMYNSVIEVPNNMTIDEAIEYAKDHLLHIPRGTIEYVGDIGIDEENCDFDED